MALVVFQVPKGGKLIILSKRVWLIVIPRAVIIMDGWVGDSRGRKWRDCTVTQMTDSLNIELREGSERRRGRRARRLGIDNPIPLNCIYGVYRESTDTLSLHFVQERFGRGKQRSLRLKGIVLNVPRLTNRRHWLVVYNSRCPKARSILDRVLLPMLSVAGSSLMVKGTEYATHAKMIGHDTDPNDYDGCLLVGGDGLVHEWVNGALSKHSLKDFPIGIIPAGTSNATCKWSTGGKCPIIACLVALRGKTTLVDLIKIEQGRRTLYAHLGLYWGYFADVDLEADGWRWLGRTRMTLAALAKLMHLKRYDCLVTLKKGKGEDVQFTLQHISTLLVMKQPWIDSEILLNPAIGPSDGKLHVLWANEGRRNLANLLLDRSGEHHLEYTVCKEIFIQVFTKNTLMDVDGEVLSGESLKASCQPASLLLFTK